MEIVKIVAFAFMALCIVFILRNNQKGVLAIQISTVVGVLIFLFMIGKITAILQLLQQLALKANIDFVYLNTIFKILGIAYLASFCGEICRDAGEGTIAAKVEFAGKILILVLSVPILMAVLQSILKII
jgi:stage III sporulation protein AD